MDPFLQISHGEIITSFISVLLIPFTCVNFHTTWKSRESFDFIIQKSLNSFWVWWSSIKTQLMSPWPIVIRLQSASISRQVSASLLKNAKGDTKRKSVRSHTVPQRHAKSGIQRFASSSHSTSFASLEISAATSTALLNLTKHLTFSQHSRSKLMKWSNWSNHFKTKYLCWKTPTSVNSVNMLPHPAPT